MAKAKDLRDQSEVELVAMHRDLCKELFLVRNEKSHQKRYEKPHRVPAIRKDIARVLTVLNEKQSNAAEGL